MANNRRLSQFANTVGYNSGKIGFNATNPPRDYCFHSGQADTNIQITNDTTGIDDSAGALIQQDGNDFYIWNKENSFMSLGTNATERLRIESDGQVVINRSSGAILAESVSKLEVYNSTQNLIWVANSTAATNQDAGIMFAPANNVYGGKIIVTSDEDFSTSANRTAHMAFYTRKDGSATEKLRIDSSGRLLVGHTDNVAPDGYESLIQTSGTDYRGGSLSIRRDGNNASGPALLLTKSRSGSIGGNTVVSNGDVLGTIWFYGADGNDVNQAGAKIQCHVDYTAGSNNMPGRLEFHTTSDGAASPTERMRIDSAGRVLIANAGSYYSSGEVLSLSTSNNGSVQVMRNTNASFNNSLIFGYTSRASNSSFQYTKFAANAASDTDFVLRGDGNAYADGSWYTGGADYAEYFEWSDGNTEAEDRRGISVVLDGDKIREAVAGEEPIGVISGNPSVVGDAAWNKWNGKYLRDDFGTYIQEDYEVEDEDGNTVVQQRRRINPAWSSENEYVTREDRAEWDTVGLMGKLRIRKGQVTGTRWVKMRDVSDTVEEWLLR